jgi:hypothetical protein
MADQKPTPNDQRSVEKNPNNPQHDQSHGNRGGQMNPQHLNYQGGHGPKETPKK